MAVSVMYGIPQIILLIGILQVVLEFIVNVLQNMWFFPRE